MFMIPADRLPPGFAERVDDPPAEPAEPRPAATVVVMRDGPDGPEALLLRRHRSSGFVPGAYVFPGGRVDRADGLPGLPDRTDGLPGGSGPDLPFWFAAVRETFEEAGILLGRDAAGEPAPTVDDLPELEGWRDALLEERATLLDALEATRARIALDDIVWFARWITPVVEPRRYDTNFFLAAVPAGREPSLHPREVTDALWIRPAEALVRFRDGRLPMIFPTVRTLESLAGFESSGAALAAFRGRRVEPLRPRLVRTDGGVGIVLDRRHGD